MPRRVGILTFHHADNYGAVLQTYALVKAVQALGHEVEVLDYRPLAARRAYNRFGLRSGKTVQTLMRRWKFRQFRNRYLPMTQRRYLTADALRKDPPNLDCVICGSDQIWNVHSFRGYDPAFFLDFVQNADSRKISYAACVGTSDDFGSHGEEIRTLLDRFDFLSVRNKNSQRCVEALTGKEPTRVLDPTFLASFDDITPPASTNNPYIFVYSLRQADVFEKTVAMVSGKLGLPVIAVGAAYQNARNLYSVGPQQWLTLIRNARFVVTNSFHGTCFSIFNQKDFLIPFMSETKMRRHQDLLEWCGVAGRVVTNPQEIAGFSEQDLKIDYVPIAERVRQAREHSQGFLARSLSS